MGVTGAALSATLFGFSRSLPALLVSRCLAGGLSGNSAVVSSMLTEMTDETNQAKGESVLMPQSYELHSNKSVLSIAFPLLAATWYIGSIM